MLLHFDLLQTLLIGLIFLWTGFVRTGLGFGGAALGLPLMLLPVAAIGHVLGLKAHDAITRNDAHFKRWIGLGLMIVSGLGL